MVRCDLSQEDDAGSTSRIVRQARKLAREAIADARETASAGAARVASLFQGWHVESGAVADSPHAAIVTKQSSRQFVICANDKDAQRRIELSV